VYRHYSEAFLGRPPNDQTELDAMQLHIWLDRGLTNSSNYGYSSRPNPPSFDQACVPVVAPAVLPLLALNDVQAFCPGLPTTAKNGADIYKSFGKNICISLNPADSKNYEFYQTNVISNSHNVTTDHHSITKEWLKSRLTRLDKIYHNIIVVDIMPILYGTMAHSTFYICGAAYFFAKRYTRSCQITRISSFTLQLR